MAKSRSKTRSKSFSKPVRRHHFAFIYNPAPSRRASFRTSLRTIFHDNEPKVLARRLAWKAVPEAVKRPVVLTQAKTLTFIQNSDTLRNVVCAKRKARRAVLFATGKSGGAHRPPTYNLESKVKC